MRACLYDIRNVPVEKKNLVMSGRGEKCRAKSLSRQAMALSTWTAAFGIGVGALP